MLLYCECVCVYIIYLSYVPVKLYVMTSVFSTQVTSQNPGNTLLCLSLPSPARLWSCLLCFLQIVLLVTVRNTMYTSSEGTLQRTVSATCAVYTGPRELSGLPEVNGKLRYLGRLGSS